MVRRFGATHNGICSTSHLQNGCRKGSNNDCPPALYLCSDSRFSCCSLSIRPDLISEPVNRSGFSFNSFIEQQGSYYMTWSEVAWTEVLCEQSHILLREPVRCQLWDWFHLTSSTTLWQTGYDNHACSVIRSPTTCLLVPTSTRRNRQVNPLLSCDNTNRD